MRYLVKISFWDRSDDGDDWVLGSHQFEFDKLGEAVKKALSPFRNSKGLIESIIFDTTDSKYGDCIWQIDYETGKINNYTSIPDFDYHNREYDQ